jgi:hypothetical protein
MCVFTKIVQIRTGLKTTSIYHDEGCAISICHNNTWHGTRLGWEKMADTNICRANITNLFKKRDTMGKETIC